MHILKISLKKPISMNTRYLKGHKHHEIEVLVRTFYKLLELGMDLDAELVEDAARQVGRGNVDPIEIYKISELQVKNLIFSKRMPLLTVEEKCQLPM